MSETPKPGQPLTFDRIIEALRHLSGGIDTEAAAIAICAPVIDALDREQSDRVISYLASRYIHAPRQRAELEEQRRLNEERLRIAAERRSSTGGN